jgi:formate hydrogenlyase subunit 6/NADH:ubiquinone oxidoreductase subunit I
LRDYVRWPRRQPLALPVERRIGVAKVEIGFDEETAREQGGRCLICTINPIFDGELCILCNGCVDVCPTDCLKLVPITLIAGDETAVAVIKRRSIAAPAASAMLLDPTRCIRCGLCAARCPTEAVKMESFRFTEELLFEREV